MFRNGLRNYLPLVILSGMAAWVFAMSPASLTLQASTAETPTATATRIPAGIPQPTLYDIENEDGDGSFSVAWDAVEGADFYRVKQQFNEKSWIPVYEGPALSLDRSGLPEGQYCYRVRAFNEIAYSDWSDIKCTVAGGKPPEATATNTTTATPSATPSATATATQEPATETPTATKTASKTPGPTSSPEPTATSSATATSISPTPAAPTASSTPPAATGAIAYLPVIQRQPQQPTATPEPPDNPLFVGLAARWDGRGFVKTDETHEPGTHWTMEFSEMTGSGTIKARNTYWYDPNPLEWPVSVWDEFYSVSSGRLLSRSEGEDPAFKWNYYRILPYDVDYQDGQIVAIDGQKFMVSGPHWGYGSFGQQITYWRLISQEKFLAWDDGSGWQLFVHPGEVTLEYDMNTRLLLKSDVLRHYYLDGALTEYTIQYINYLTASNAYPD